MTEETSSPTSPDAGLANRRDPLDVADALWGHEPVSRLEMAHATDGTIVFSVREKSIGFGSRASGVETANKLANLLIEMPDERIAVDFEGVDVASASFVDEFLAKLVKRYGVAAFKSR